MSHAPPGFTNATFLLHRRKMLMWLGAGLGGGAAIQTDVAIAAKQDRNKPQDRLPALVSDDVLHDFRLFLAGRHVLDIQDFGGAHSRRDVAEVVLLLKGLAQARFSKPMDMLARPTDARLKMDLRSGLGVCTATTFWRGDFAEHEPGLLFSLPLVEDGEFEAGLYAMPGNRKALAVRGLEDLRHLKVLSNRDWPVDWQTLGRLGLGDNLVHVGNWSLMPRMLAAGRADVLLAPFQATADMALQVDGITLLPVKGLKVSMRGTRHFVVSSQHPAGRVLASALDAGLMALRRSGVIRQAYVQSGFFHPEVKDWTRL